MVHCVSAEGGPEAAEGGEAGPGGADEGSVRDAGGQGGGAAGLHPQLRAARPRERAARHAGSAPWWQRWSGGDVVLARGGAGVEEGRYGRNKTA